MATISQSEFERQIVSLGLVSSRKSAEAVSKHIRKALAGRRNDSDFAALLPGLRQLSAVGGNDQAARMILVKSQLWLGPDEGQKNHLGYRFHTKLAATLGVSSARQSSAADTIDAVARIVKRVQLAALAGQFGAVLADLKVDFATLTKGAGHDGVTFLTGGDVGATGVIA